ncbi:hypothetical protein CU098_008219, partial [Rhizopus stolonifer]
VHQHPFFIALLLDQEKAYDCVHPGYLSSTMHNYQEDHLSPLLFSITFDSFLRLIADDRKLKGFQFSEEAPAHSHSFDCLDDLIQTFEQLCVTHSSLTTVHDLTSQLAASPLDSPLSQ